MSPRRRVATSPFARLQAFAEFWVHDAPTLPCCLFVSDEEVEADPQAFRCETCPVADQLAALGDDPANAQAWRLFQVIVTRMAVDTQTVAWRLERATAEMSPDEIDDLLARFRLLYDIVSPAPTRDEGDHGT